MFCPETVLSKLCNNFLMTGKVFCAGIYLLAHKRGGTMNVNSRITELKRKHVTISHAVELAQKSPSSDYLQVAEMKRKKLRLKEEITRLTG